MTNSESPAPEPNRSAGSSDGQSGSPSGTSSNNPQQRSQQIEKSEAEDRIEMAREVTMMVLEIE